MTESVILLIIGGAVTTMFSILMVKITRMQSKNDKRYEQRVTREQVHYRQVHAIGDLSHKTACVLTDKGVVNGDLKNELHEYEKSRDDYFGFINDEYVKLKSK